jgi:hypothetical protein
MIALQVPDGTLTPLTRSWAHGFGGMADQPVQRGKTLDSLAAFKAFAFARFLAQKDGMLNYVASLRQREAERMSYAQQVAETQENLRRDNAARNTKRLQEIEDQQRRELERAAATAASIAEAAQRG